MQFETNTAVQTAEAPAPLDVQKELPPAFADNQSYKEKLKALPEVQNLTNEININDTNSILQFGQKPSEEISKVSDELLNSMKAVKSEEASEMITQLTKIMDKFDIKEIEDPEKQQSVIKKLFKKAQDEIQKLFEKYDNMGKEVDKIYVILKQYESDIQKANDGLDRMFNANVAYFEQLEKYIVAGEIGLQEIDDYKASLMNSGKSQEELQMQIQKLDITKDMLSQRIYDLQIAENVAMQTCPMIQTMQMSNFNLLRKINSSFIITLPIFKQCLIQAINLKRQAIQAKSMKELDDKTNELLQRNAQNTATQSVQIARMTGGSSINIETLQNTYQTIQNGISETKKINEEIAAERARNSVTLEEMKADMKKKGIV
jgi:uncharacterized protein YaaN involved in tellurite resistance